MKKILLLLVVSVGLISCDLSVNKKNNLGDKVSGEKVAGWYFYHVNSGNYDSLPKLMSDDFYKDKSEAVFTQELKDREAELGPILSFNLKDWETARVKKGNHKETKFIFIYDVDFEKGKGEEKISLERKDHKIKITEIDFNKK